MINMWNFLFLPISLLLRSLSSLHLMFFFVLDFWVYTMKGLWRNGNVIAFLTVEFFTIVQVYWNLNYGCYCFYCYHLFKHQNYPDYLTFFEIYKAVYQIWFFKYDVVWIFIVTVIVITATRTIRLQIILAILQFWLIEFVSKAFPSGTNRVISKQNTR